MPNSKISALGLDIGSKRIGVAGCDGTGLIASGIATIKRTSFIEDLAQLEGIVREREVQVLVVGLPYSLEGKLGFQAKKVQNYVKRVAAALEIPVEYVDERLTSVEAEEMLKAEGISPSKNKALIDRKAACLILQEWLEQRRKI